MKSTLLNLEDMFSVLDTEAVIYFAVSLIVLAIAKYLNDICVSYNLNEQLTKKDNRAIALSFSGYLFAVAIILAGVLGSPSTILETESAGMYLLKDIGNTVLWSMIGILLLLLSRVINDRFLLPHFDNVKELETDRNIGVGAVQGSTYIATALIISGSLYGEDEGGFITSLLLTLLYFVLSQFFFILFGILYEKMTLYSLHEELEQDNAAAGVGYGLTLVALGILISRYLFAYDSIIGLFVWTCISAIVLVLCRHIVDKFFLPGDLLDNEIQKDRNWGAALIEGVVAIGLALVLTSTFIA